MKVKLSHLVTSHFILFGVECDIKNVHYIVFKPFGIIILNPGGIVPHMSYMYLPIPSSMELHLKMTLSSKFMAFPTKYINMYIYT